MKYSKILLILFTGLVLSVGASEAKKAIEKRIAPVGSVCVQGEDCGSTSAATTVVASSSGRNGVEVQSGALALCYKNVVARAQFFSYASSSCASTV